jgi:hypothetical protein
MADKFLWHLTSKKNWTLDPAYRPIYAYGMTAPMSKPGLFVTENPVYWSPWMGVGPIYAVRVAVPEDAMPHPSTWSTSHPEYFITELDRIKILEVLPLSEAIKRGLEEKSRGINWWDQQYVGFGSVMDWWFFYDQAKDKKFTRKGLEDLMKEWKKANPGFKDPDVYFRAKYR